MVKDIKNCKIRQLDDKNITQNGKINENFAKNQTLDFELITWIRTLLCTRKFLPNIIKLVDELFVEKASNPNIGSFIFGDYKSGTYGQVEDLFEINQRKIDLINIKILVDAMVDSLEEKYQNFVKLKFYESKSNENVAILLGINERTVSRWHKIILEKLYKYCKLGGYDLKFVKGQIKHEYWMLNHYLKSKKAIMQIYKDQTYNKLSSSI